MGNIMPGQDQLIPEWQWVATPKCDRPQTGWYLMRHHVTRNYSIQAKASTQIDAVDPAAPVLHFTGR